MGKRKKVDLNNLSPLQSVTIGEIKKPKFVLLKTFLLIGLFLGVVFYMDEIKVYLDKYIGVYFGISSGDTTNTGVTDTTTNNTTTNNTTEEPTLEYDTFEFGTDSEVDYLNKYNIKLSNITITDDNVLSFDISTDDTSYSLDEHNLYFIVFNSDNVALNYFYLSGTVSKDSSLSKTFTTNGGTIFAIRELSEEDYPVYDSLADNDGNSKVICTKDGEVYTYYFTDAALNKVELVSTFANNIANYSDLKSSYSKLKLNYEEKDGIDTSFDASETNQTTTFNFSVDYSKYNNKIDGGLFYSKASKLNKVKFENESNLYDCVIEDLTEGK